MHTIRGSSCRATCHILGRQHVPEDKDGSPGGIKVAQIETCRSQATQNNKKHDHRKHVRKQTLPWWQRTAGTLHNYIAFFSNMRPHERYDSAWKFDVVLNYALYLYRTPIVLYIYILYFPFISWCDDPI